MQGTDRRGLMLILSSPSGAGKTTLARHILKVDQHIHTSISVTTRKKRPNEIDGVHYYFTDHANFKQMIRNGEFLEYAEIFGELYGTPRKFVDQELLKGEDVLFDIDWQGNRQISAIAKEDVVSVFIFPPSKQELFNRLVKRAQDDESTIQNRMDKADDELSHWHEYDYSIINRDLVESLNKLLAILRAERLKKARRLGVTEFVQSLLTEKIDYIKVNK
ncbi:guanylate kinase [Rickettsiales endosymbiont of Peranema trichophorum]|uniref:guanylate kinase n=1 Tax=Rickettsiales endosymbiont of Peranema trichophorum TaxID=2486577 RepID=UPI001A92D06D|nr:guanylate kinase [Rickettsiales endosymbiont of Peranema trichophorum]